MSKRELLADMKDSKTRKCIKTGCGKDATHNVDYITHKATTKMLTRRDSKEFCADHAKELEESLK